MLKKAGLTLLILAAVAATAFYIAFANFKNEHLDALKSGSQIIQTNNGPIEYQIVGSSGPVVLFLHGSPGGYDQAIAIPEYTVVVPSRPGYLRTPIEVGRTPSEQADAYIELLDALGIESVVVMGASGGGPSAIAFAANHPERTKGLIALEAVSQKVDIPGEMPFFLRADFLMWGMLTVMDAFLGDEGIISLLVPSPAIQQLILADSEKTDKIKDLIWSVWPVSRRIVGQQNDVEQFRQLELPITKVVSPTLIVHGTEDINVPFSQSEALAQQIPSATFTVVEGADHMMPFSHAEQVDDAVEQFLVSLSLRDR
jgi:pimeloyl-ACP methyl ester carboxylesterase